MFFQSTGPFTQNYLAIYEYKILPQEQGRDVSSKIRGTLKLRTRQNWGYTAVFIFRIYITLLKNIIYSLNLNQSKFD